ncbi:putative thiazole-containing bacteriocin maturation protein [Aneurinibacillus sp. Ricciae_BoGa-3]|uniref:putative thiazole-containing bacteriocin maturation protein n=1 Tax=Aneurinibacillus sp. Ricciae_BoGa-3 TaxID=3022697 RepID=UPI00234113B0|nr:putative thiazole-containing bacteriocin maturation protein [Aneurinibacillus sp. Ricciae_BoGa-3]WCK55099.1 putative thiazole-containing bacteriocin maturation protein [Aneurinibacillus sp. Ricciae_BoGa-3]
MVNLAPSTRLKVKRDTFFLPDPNNAVYFRNNVGSFRIEGSAIHQWIEKLIPMFNGQYTLKDLTDGLPAPHRDRVYEIAQILYQNGFVRDVSQDRTHHLTGDIVKRYASQIEFLDSFGDSGAYRFQTYRQAKVLAVGSGPLFASLVSALLESGLPKFHVMGTDSLPTNRQRLMELEAHARKTDPEVEIEEATLQQKGMGSWRQAVQPFDSILYVSQEGHVEQLQLLHAICREEKKLFLPAICLQQVGIAGPLVHPDSEGCWESAWRRMHQSTLYKDQQFHKFSTTAGAMLANVIVFELFKKTAGVAESQQKNQFFLLNMETLEGNWHSFLPHPLVTGLAAAQWVSDPDLLLQQSSNKPEQSRLLSYFSQLTSMESGILHSWEEGDLQQLPLAQCRVQAVDPLSDGPAGLLPEIICTDFTHEGARREAGLAGLEAYVSRMARRIVSTLPSYEEAAGGRVEPHEFVGVGVGETVAEGVSRGLQRYLAEELGKRYADRNPFVFQVKLDAIEDEQCRFYLQALTTMQGTPLIALGEEVYGFPVVWVGTNGRWYGSAGLNLTIALRKSLQHAILKAQNPACLPDQSLVVSSVVLEENEPLSLVVPAYEETEQSQALQSALEVLKRQQQRMMVVNLTLEPFIKEELAGAFGVLLRGEESQ